MSSLCDVISECSPCWKNNYREGVNIVEANGGWFNHDLTGTLDVIPQMQSQVVRLENRGYQQMCKVIVLQYDVTV